MHDTNDHSTNSPDTIKTGFENLANTKVLLCLLLLLLSGSFLSFLLQKSEVLEKYYGIEQVKLARELNDSDDSKLLRSKINLWTSGIIIPFLALLFPLALTTFTNLNRNNLGWKTQNLLLSLRITFGKLLLLIPAVYLVQLAMVKVQSYLPGQTVTEHPLTQLADADLMPLEWFLVFNSAVIGAPLLEEQVFRGLIQPWAMAKKNGYLFISCIAILIGIIQFKDDWVKVFQMLGEDAPESITLFRSHLTKALLPFVFSLLAGIGIFVISIQNKKSASICATALLFGMIHAFAWPSPVGLTLLGIGLGFAYQESKNIIAPIGIHMGFNAFAFTLLIIQ